MQKKKILGAILALSILLGGFGYGISVTAAANIDMAAWGQTVMTAFETFEKDNVDPYAVYYTAQEYQKMMETVEGSFGGIGAYMQTIPETGATVVVAPIKDTPAYRAGMLAGDEITAVNGANIRYQDTDYIVSLIRGPAGSKVQVTVYRKNAGTLTFDMTRETITAPSIDGQVLPGHPEIAYLFMSTFTEQTGGEFTAVWQKLNAGGAIKGLIIDVRYNPGGSLYGALDFINQLLPTDTLMVSLKGKDTDEDYKASKGDKVTVPIVILQNENSASAAEVMIGALKDNNRAVSVGTKSFGKGVVQSLVGLTSGAGFKSTDARYFTPGGYDIQGVGIEPTDAVAWPKELAASKIFALDPAIDPQLAKALELLGK